MKIIGSKRGAIAIAVVAVAWAFVGVERVPGDHEVGVSWEAFLKHRLSARLVFENPARRGLEVVPFEALSSAEQASLIAFCRIRFGTVDPDQCQAIDIARRSRI